MRKSLAGLPTLEQVKAEMARRSLREFVRQAWHVVEPATPFVDGWHLDAISEHLQAVTEGHIRNLLINVPPRHQKSLQVAVFWPAWEWTTYPERRWLFSSYAQSLAVRDSLKCRRLIQSPWYQRNWGHLYHLTSDQNVKARFENNKTGYRLSTSVDSAATGEGGDRVVVDDPHNVREAHSKTIREATIQWWDETMSTRINDPRTGAKVIVMQRVHENDLSGHVLEQGGYVHLCLPAEFERKRKCVTPIGWEDPRTEPGELLWPERFDRETLDSLKRTLGSYGVSGQLQQNPTPSEGGMLKRIWWKHYNTMPNPRHFDEIILSWDMAFKETDTSDFVVGQVWGRMGADKYLLDQVRDRMDFPRTIQAVKALAAKWPQAVTKLVEDKANGPAVIDSLKREIPGLIAVTPQGNKESRVAAVSPEVESGNVFIPDTSIASWINDFIEECAAFPKGTNDDQVDAMTQALLRWQGAQAQDQDAISILRGLKVHG